MASVPSAVAQNPPPNPLDQYGRLLQMKSLLQNQQLQQQDIQEKGLQNQVLQAQVTGQQTLQKLFSSGNYIQKDDSGKPTGFDMDKLGRDALAQGVPLGMWTDQQNKYYEGVKNKVAAGTAQIDQEKAVNGQAYQIGEGVRGITDPAQQQAAYQASLPKLQQLGIDVSKFPPQYPGDAGIKAWEATLGVHAQMLSDAETQAKTAKDQADTALANVKVQGLKASPQDIQTAVQGIVPQNWPDPTLAQRTISRVNAARVLGDTEGMNKALADASAEVGSIKKETNPAVQANKVATAQAEGIARANVEAQVARGSNAALATVPQHLVAPASAAATKAGEDYAQAQSVSQRLQAMMDAATHGNVVSYQLIPQEGALQITTSQGVHRINMAEIQNYGGGSLWQKMQGHIGKALTGESIPSSVLGDMAEMQKIQAEGSQTKYENTLKTINQTYGAQFKPVQMDNIPRNQPGGGTKDFFSQFGGTARPQ